MNGLYEGSMMIPHGLEYTLYTLKITIGFMSALMVLLGIAWIIERRTRKR